ncbi:hypothetical protein PGSY75_1314100 [Plasmodium gaboni]|uniref:Uncharacterized protein n=1 Tax=Plasmodium gaboni TaxID=647221 RepID=A0A151LDA7_9APIC|nr:hypothetical protein PGSY75_1314100 [Plasmodium gaboni]KYN96942.1 hypothetical protein PGSY75_1314100 [Plasmodium gaboni]
MDQQDCLPSEIKDALISLHDEHFSYQKYLNVLKDYIYLDPIKNINTLINYILNNINNHDIEKNICHYLSDVIIYIQDINKIISEENNIIEEKLDESDYSNSLFYEEYRIKIKDEKLKKYDVGDYRINLIQNCTRNINYLKLMYIISNVILPKNGYVLFINIFHKHEINYQYKLLSLEYFANIANKINIDRAKYIAQILPLILEKFYNTDGEPYYNDNINNIDILLSMCKFINILCDESIKAQEDDKQDVALYSIVAFIMRIICYHSVYLPINRNVEKLGKYIYYDHINYNECLKEYSNLTYNLYKSKKHILIKNCLSSLIWRLSIINPNLPRTIERVNILIPNTKACALENSTMEISILCYLILIERVNINSFPLVFSELYLLNLMIRNSYNLILCVSNAKESLRDSLLIKAYHFIIVCCFLSKCIYRKNKEYYTNIYKFKWRPYDFLKLIYETIHNYNHLKFYTKHIYYSISNIMRNFQWDIFFSIYNRLIIESSSDTVRSIISSYVKDELFKKMIHVVDSVQQIDMISCEFTTQEILKGEDGNNFVKEKEINNKHYSSTNDYNNNDINKEHIPYNITSNIQSKNSKENEIHKIGCQIKKIVHQLIGEESVLLYIDSITVALNIIKMILLNKRFTQFYKYIIKVDETSTCFIQNKMKYFYDQIKIEKSVLSYENQKNNNSITQINDNNDILQTEQNLNTTFNNINMNKLDIVLMLLSDIEKSIAEMKQNINTSTNTNTNTKG